MRSTPITIRENGLCKHGLKRKKKSKEKNLFKIDHSLEKMKEQSHKDDSHSAASSKPDYHVLKEMERIQKMKVKLENDYRDLFNQWRLYDFYSTFFAITGLVVACIDLEHGIAQMFSKPDKDKNPNAMDDPRNQLVSA